MSGISRRSALAGIAAAAAIAPTIAPAATGIGSLWDQYMALIRVSRELFAAYDDAYQSMPVWAQAGPKYINSSGEYCRETCGWPLDESILPPDRESFFRVVRVSPHEVRDRFKEDAAMFPRQRAELRARMRRRLRRLIPLLRAQLVEKERAGIAAAEQRMDVNYKELWKVEDEIKACPASAERTVALIMINLVCNCTMEATIENDAGMEVAEIAFTGLQPLCTGLIAQHVAFFLQDRETPLREMPWVGV